MKFEKLMQVLSLERYCDAAIIEKRFDYFHTNFLSKLSYWSITATRRKLITDFWLSIIGTHFSILLFLGVLAGQCFSPGLHSSTLYGMFFFLPIIAIMLFISCYWPIYQLEFLPKLDSYSEHYSGKQMEGMQKCKKQQYSVLGLMLIQFVSHKVSGIATPSLSTEENVALVKLYGVSNKMIEASLKTIIQNHWDKTKERKRTEIGEAFAEAQEYFSVFKSEKANGYLNKLEQKLFSTKSQE